MEKKTEFAEEFSRASLDTISIALQKLMNTSYGPKVFDKQLIENINTLRNLTNSADAQLHFMDEENKRIVTDLSNLYISSDEDQTQLKSKVQLEHISEAVAKLKEALIVNNMSDLAAKFPAGVQLSNEYATNFICVPICNSSRDRCFIVFELYRENGKPYSTNDIRLVISAAKWMTIGMNQTEGKLRDERTFNLNMKLRIYVEQYFIGSLDFLPFLAKIVSFTKKILRVERIYYYKTDVRPNAVAFQADLYEENVTKDVFRMVKRPTKAKFHRDKGIAGQVAKTGHTINLNVNKENINLLNSELYKNLIVPVKNILCVPVKYSDNIIGIMHLINKQNVDENFTAHDEVILERICVYLSLVQNFEKIASLSAYEFAKGQIIKNLFSHQVNTLIKIPKFSKLKETDLPAGFHDFDWYPKKDDQTISLLFYMFDVMLGGIIDNEEALYETLINVQKCYKPVPFQNFLHAFDTVHTMFCILRRISEKFSDVERMGLMLASLCLSINSEGYNNSYYTLISHPLTQVYDEPHLQNFRATFGKQLITYSKLLDKIAEDDRIKIWKIFTDAIVHTNSTYSQGLRVKLLKIIDDNKFDWNNHQHRVYHLNLVMWSASTSRCAKPFRIAKFLCEDLYRELFYQGDQEKLLKKLPSRWMDRNNVHHIPEQELDYIRKVCLPYYDMLRKLHPSLEDYYNLGNELAKAWESMIELRHKKAWNPDESIGKSFEYSTK